MRRGILLIGLLIAGLVTGAYGFRTSKAKAPPANRTGQASPLTRALWMLSGIQTSPLYIRVVDTTTRRGIPGAGCIVAETNQRIETDARGFAPVIRAPVLRDPRRDELVAAISGDLTVICYKNGYRDKVITGVHMYKDTATQFETDMTPFSDRDKRIEPTYHHIEPHRLWKIQVADRYRLFDQGEGRESPELTRKGNRVAPQSEIGGGRQFPPPQQGPGAAAESRGLQQAPPR